MGLILFDVTFTDPTFSNEACAPVRGHFNIIKTLNLCVCVSVCVCNKNIAK